MPSASRDELPEQEVVRAGDGWTVEVRRRTAVEDWNAEKWGVDEEVASRKAAKLIDFNAVASILEALRQEV